MEQMQKMLWNLLDQAQGYKELPDEILQLLTQLALLKKINNDEFFELFKTAPNNQREKLKYVIDNLSDSDVISIIDYQNFSHVSDELFNHLIYAVNSIDDEQLPQLAISIRSLLQNQGRQAGESINTDNIAVLVKMLLGDVTDKIIYDGAAGYANIVSHLDCKNMLLEESNQRVWKLSKTLLLLQNKTANYKLADSLKEPSFLAGNKKADIAVMSPPMSLKFRMEQCVSLAVAEYIQVDSGNKLPTSSGDVVWLQQALANINENGTAILITPQGWLFRGGYDAKVRKYLLNNDLIESIIGLPSGVLIHTGIPPVIVVLNKNKTNPGIIHFIDASQYGEKQRKSVQLSDKDINQIKELNQGEHPENLNFRSVLLPDVINNDGNLNIGRYIKKEIEWKLPDLAEEEMKLQKVQQNFNKAQAELLVLLGVK